MSRIVPAPDALVGKRFDVAVAKMLGISRSKAADLVDSLGQENNPEWKTVAINTDGEMVAPNGSIGFRWGEKGKWNLEQRDGTSGNETELQLSLLGS